MTLSKKNLPFLVAFLIFVATTGLAQKLTAEELVAKHLESVGSADARKKLKNQMAMGLVQYTVLRAGGAGANGRVVFASEGGKSLVGMTFPIPSYPAETIVYDGTKMKISYVANNTRSYIGDYLYRYDAIVKEGLLGGTLSTAWPLYDLAARKAKLEYDGTKKFGGKEYHVLSYSKRGGSDIDVKLFFDTSTFRHARTEYRRIVSSQVGTAGLTSAGTSGFPPPSAQGSVGSRAADASSSQRELKQILIEEFSDFKAVNGLTVPHGYRAYLLLEGAQGTREYEWKAMISDFFINQPIDPSAFNTSEK